MGEIIGIIKALEQRLKFLKKLKKESIIESNKDFYAGSIYEVKGLIKFLKKGENDAS